MLDNADDSLPNGIQRRGGKFRITTVPERAGVGLRVENEAVVEAPVENWAGDQEGIAKVGVLRGFFLEVVLHGDFVLEDGEFGGLRVHCVAAELGRQETFNADADCSVDEGILVSDGCCG